MQAGLTVTLLAALGLFFMLIYAMGVALTARNSYASMSLRREIEDTRAQNALLRYQINLMESNGRVRQAAKQMQLRPSLVQEADYVVIPDYSQDPGMQLATAGPTRASAGLAATLAELATEVVDSARGRAEASTVQGHRP